MELFKVFGDDSSDIWLKQGNSWQNHGLHVFSPPESTYAARVFSQPSFTIKQRHRRPLGYHFLGTFWRIIAGKSKFHDVNGWVNLTHAFGQQFGDVLKMARVPHSHIDQTNHLLLCSWAKGVGFCEECVKLFGEKGINVVATFRHDLGNTFDARRAEIQNKPIGAAWLSMFFVYLQRQPHHICHHRSGVLIGPHYFVRIYRLSTILPCLALLS